MSDTVKYLGRIFSRTNGMVTITTYMTPEEFMAEMYGKDRKGIAVFPGNDNEGGPVDVRWDREDVVGASIGILGASPKIEKPASKAGLVIPGRSH